MTPPLFARMLLFTFAGEPEADFVAGDLHEEFLLLCADRGLRAGRRWYSRQVVRSIYSLWSLRMRNGEAAHVTAVAGFGIALPLLLLDRLWSFVYSLIPLKDGLHRAPGFLAANIVCACVLAALCGATANTMPRALAIAAASAGAAAFAVWGSAASAPSLYVGLLVCLAPASALVTFKLRSKYV